MLVACAPVRVFAFVFVVMGSLLRSRNSDFLLLHNHDLQGGGFWPARNSLTHSSAAAAARRRGWTFFRPSWYLRRACVRRRNEAVWFLLRREGGQGQGGGSGSQHCVDSTPHSCSLSIHSAVSDTLSGSRRCAASQRLLFCRWLATDLGLVPRNDE